jgi:hypothetical protein
VRELARFLTALAHCRVLLAFPRTQLGILISGAFPGTLFKIYL